MQVPSTPLCVNHADEPHSSCVYVTGISDSGEQREPDPWHSRSQLFDLTNHKLTGNPFSAGEVASDNSLSEEGSVLLLYCVIVVVSFSCLGAKVCTKRI